MVSIGIAAPPNAEQPSVAEALSEIGSKIEESKFADATSYLNTLDAQSLAEKSAKGGDTIRLGMMGYGPLIPGLPEWSSKSLSATILPGTSDYLEDAEQAAYNEAAMNFASKFNMLARHFDGSVVKHEGEIELDTIRDGLEMSKSDWIRIPLIARLRIRNLAEECMSLEI